MKLSTAKKLTKITTNILVFALGLTQVGSAIALSNATTINNFLGVATSVIVDAEDSADLDTEYFKSDFDSVAQVQKNNRELSERIVAEGIVLLKNENGALPLAKGSGVSLFSTSSVDPVYSGTGSSGNSSGDTVTLKDGLERNGNLKVNPELWNWYTENLDVYGRSGSGTLGGSFSVGDAEWNEIGTDAKTDKAYGDAAIFVLSRRGGEASDLTISGGNSADLTDGNYLTLSPAEMDVLKHLKAEKDKGTYSSIIVVMNSANPVQCDFVNDAAYGVDAMLWVGTFGAVGPNALGDILVGEVNPSGSLTDTFWKEHWMNPVYANWGDYSYIGSVQKERTGTGLLAAITSNNDKYVVYQEGIYNGYLYTETRYEDAVMGRANTGDFDYYDNVAYPFGYGLSYTNFAYSDYKVAYDTESDTYQINVTVTNTGDVAGKETVQIYLQKPYTEYDIETGIEKASVELVAFDKTKQLAPGESQTLTIEVEKSNLACYDAYGFGTYILEEGDYYLTAATDAHNAVNNILAAKGYTTANGMTEEGNAAMADKITENHLDTVSYSISDTTGNKITNQFDNADLNLYEGENGNSVTYVSRNDWEGTVVLGYDEHYNSTKQQVVLTESEQIVADRTPRVSQDDIEYPTYDSTETSYQLIDLRAYEDGTPIPYDDPMWDDLLDQMSRNDTIELLSCGIRMTYSVASINKPETIDHNGATGPVQSYGSNPAVNRGLAIDTNDEDMDEKPTVFPCNGLVAATFNKELVKEYGDAWGETCLWAGYSGLYGPAVNIHRGAYGGRCFEYYSEDAYLSGAIAAEVSKGLVEHGTYVYLKHCVLNDQEQNRYSVSTWANEQTIRERYLKAFEIAIEDGGAQCVMTGYNRIGSQWTGNQGFINSVLRGEFGMKGLAITDFYVSTYLDDYMTLPYAITQGQDLPDGDALGVGNDMLSAMSGGVPFLNEYDEGYGELAWAMREAAHHILYTVVQSNAMNGISAGTRVIKVTPVWQTALGVSVYVLGALLVLSAGGFVACVVIEKKKKPVEKPVC